jgi:hypothetical protein
VVADYQVKSFCLTTKPSIRSSTLGFLWQSLNEWGLRKPRDSFGNSYTRSRSSWASHNIYIQNQSPFGFLLEKSLFHFTLRRRKGVIKGISILLSLQNILYSEMMFNKIYQKWSANREVLFKIFLHFLKIIFWGIEPRTLHILGSTPALTELHPQPECYIYYQLLWIIALNTLNFSYHLVSTSFNSSLQQWFLLWPWKHLCDVDDGITANVT